MDANKMHKLSEYFKTPPQKHKEKLLPAPATPGLEFEMPEFLHPDKIKDQQGRSRGDPEYDPSTLQVPPTAKFTPAMQQYWDIKREHFDKIVLFKMGKFYELFYHDAVTVQPLLDLRSMGADSRKAHVGFPEKSLDRMSKMIVDAGYRVCVVEQTEVTLKNRKQKAGKAVQREVSEVISKATYAHNRHCEDYEPNYFLSLVEEWGSFGVCLVDSATSKFILGELSKVQLHTLLAQARPSEVLYHPLRLGQETVKFLAASKMPPIFRKRTELEKWSPVHVPDAFAGTLPTVFEDCPMLVLAAVAGAFSYLKEMLILQKLLLNAQFVSYHESVNVCNNLILDHRAFETLELLEATENRVTSKKGSLFEFLDKAATAWGKRMLKRWIAAPLFSLKKIQERQEAVAELVENPVFIEKFNRNVKRLPDLERKLSRISTYAVKTDSKAVYFEDISSMRIKEFVELLGELKELQGIVEESAAYGFVSAKLNSILRLQPEGAFPPLRELCALYEARIVWVTGSPEPFAGLYPLFDGYKQEISELAQSLEELLFREKEHFRKHPEVVFVNSKFRYEIEVPLTLLERCGKPPHFEETSARKNFQRFYTKELKALTDRLEIAEDDLKNAKKPFLVDLLAEFYQEKLRWDSAISLAAELDSLCALASAVKNAPFRMSRPILLEAGKHLEVEDLVHPVLAARNPSFISNSLRITEDAPIVVLTGPNMGGKSTVLRALALAVVLAQIGSFVPATHMTCSLVDRIFTRMGATDSLSEGKSTFQIEVEEANAVMLHGSGSSLAIIDEFGRGTSTEDGASLAFGYVETLSEELPMRCLFTTHYHMITGHLARVPRVCMFYMDIYLDEETQNVIFLFKLKNGICRQSYASNVARMAGLPEAVIVQATVLANEYAERRSN